MASDIKESKMNNHFSMIEEIKHMVNDCHGTTIKQWLTTAATFACMVLLGVGMCVIGEMIKP
jgi:hypothetical protein